LQGWTTAGLYGKGETKFEMTADEWKQLQLKKYGVEMKQKRTKKI
jgi:hypothetical protein